MPINRLFCGLAFSFLIAPSLLGQDTKYPPRFEQIPGPEKAADFSAWLADIQHWRMERLIRMGYDSSQYVRPELKWAQSSYIQPQMMIHERTFFDPDAGKYTVDRYLDDLRRSTESIC